MALIPAFPILGKCPLKLDGSPLTLRVIVGQGQLNEGSYDIKATIKSPPSASGIVQSGLPVALGADTDLVGQRLSVLITVAAMLSLDTSITVDLTGGKTDIHIVNATKANQIGDVVAYEAYFRFTKT